MKKLIILLLIIRSLFSQIIPDDEIKETNKADLPNPIQIATYKYNSIDKINSKPGFEISNKNIISSIINFNSVYPLYLDVPKVEILKMKDISIIKFMDVKKIDRKKDPKKILKDIEEIIDYWELNRLDTPFTLESLFIYRNEDDESGHSVQVILAWNVDRTYLILNFPTKNSDIFDIKFGRGIDKYPLSNDVPEKSRLIYEISTIRMIKVGCQSINSENQVMQRKTLSMNKYQLFGLGGELLILQGPCLNDESTASNLKLEISNSVHNFTKTSQLNYNNNSNLFSLITPFLWFPGVYEFKISYANVDFISEAEIYFWDSPLSKFELVWNESSQMNNPKYEHIYITLIKIFSGSEIQKTIFYTLDVLKTEELKEVQLEAKEIESIEQKLGHNYFNVFIKGFVNSNLNIFERVGFFAVSDKSKRLFWTKPFSLIWLKNYINGLSDSLCKTILAQKSDQTYICPDYMDTAKNLKSSFKEINSESILISDRWSNYSCYSQIIPEYQHNRRGVTCCYFKASSSLSYGQDFYISNKTNLGSYSWSISPLTNILKHFLKDRIPILSCCVISDNEKLCSDYWNQHQHIMISKSPPDFRGDIFGDPHFIPFKENSKYSFLGKGEFKIIETTTKKFTLQGRFYYERLKASFLKAIAFATSSLHIVITTAGNNVTNLPWKILLGNSTELIRTLPFQDEDLRISSNENYTKLYIHLHFPDDSNIFLELERLYYMNDLLEFINMQILISNNFEKSEISGLFGKFDNIDSSSSLYMQGSNTPLKNSSLNNYKKIFDFCNSWKLNSNFENLFIDMKFTDEKEVFKNLPTKKVEDCDDLQMCFIERNRYPQDNFYKSTIKALKSRSQWEKYWQTVFLYGKVCDHPSWNQFKLNSTNFLEGSTIEVVGCLDASLIMEKDNQTLTCKIYENGSRVWIPKYSFEGSWCKSKVNPDTTTVPPSERLILTASVSVLCIFLIAFIVIVIIIIIWRRRKVANLSQSDINLNTFNNTPDIYENPITNEISQDYYCSYAEIVKPKFREAVP